MNSPGGSAYASEVIQREIIALKAKKPVIVSMGNYAASGGYWVSTFGDRIFAETNTITGSIGVFGMFFDVQKIANTFGVTFDVAKTGNYADFETITRPKTQPELDLAQARVDDLYGKFLDKVSAAATSPIEQLQLIAQGRVWSGTRGAPAPSRRRNRRPAEGHRLRRRPSQARGRTIICKEVPQQPSFAETLALLFNNQEAPLEQPRRRQARPPHAAVPQDESRPEDPAGIQRSARHVRPPPARLRRKIGSSSGQAIILTPSSKDQFRSVPSTPGSLRPLGRRWPLIQHSLISSCGL